MRTRTRRPTGPVNLTASEWMTKALQDRLTVAEKATKLSSLLAKQIAEQDRRMTELAAKKEAGTLTTSDLTKALDAPLADLRASTAALLCVREWIVRQSQTPKVES